MFKLLSLQITILNFRCIRSIRNIEIEFTIEEKESAVLRKNKESDRFVNHRK